MRRSEENPCLTQKRPWSKRNCSTLVSQRKKKVAPQYPSYPTLVASLFRKDNTLNEKFHRSSTKPWPKGIMMTNNVKNTTITIIFLIVRSPKNMMIITLRTN